MYYLKELKLKYPCISYGRDDESRNEIILFKHKGSHVFKKYSIVFEVIFKGRRLIIEF